MDVYKGVVWSLNGFIKTDGKMDYLVKVNGFIKTDKRTGVLKDGRVNGWIEGGCLEFDWVYKDRRTDGLLGVKVHGL